MHTLTLILCCLALQSAHHLLACQTSVLSVHCSTATTGPLGGKRTHAAMLCCFRNPAGHRLPVDHLLHAHLANKLLPSQTEGSLSSKLHLDASLISLNSTIDQEAMLNTTPYITSGLCSKENQITFYHEMYGRHDVILESACVWLEDVDVIQ